MVSVIIATYNWSSVLPFSIGSVLRQTHRDFELLVVGDGCTDDSASVVTAIKDPRIRWIDLGKNHGHQSAPNNEGLRQARGDVIAYLGHDDLWLPRHLELAMSALDGGADLTYSVVETIAPNDDSPTFEPSEMEHYRPGLWIPPSCVVHRRSLIEKVGGWKRFEDVYIDPEADLWHRMRQAGARFSYIRRLTAVKFPATWRKNAYAERRCDEQAAWSHRIDSEPDFEATELAKMLQPFFPDERDARRFRQVWHEFRQDISARFRRRLMRMGLVKPPTREKFMRQRLKFKGLR